jgi:hypothetical protein
MGLMDMVTSISGKTQAAQSKTVSLAGSSTDPSIKSQLSALGVRMGASASSTYNLGNNANNSVNSLFSPASGSAVVGLNNAAQCVCGTFFDDMTKDFMTGLGSIMEGAGLNGSLSKTQDMLDYVNSLTDVDQETMNRLTAMADDAMGTTASKMRDVAGAVGEATGINTAAKEFASAFTMASTVMASCVPKDFFGLNSVRNMLASIWPVWATAIDIGLQFDPNQMRDAACGLLGSSGIGDTMLEHQSGMNDYVSSFLS